jgi:hypothetical protein
LYCILGHPGACITLSSLFRSQPDTVVDVTLGPLLTYGLQIGVRIKNRALLSAAQGKEKT